ncbi:DUF2118 domain-containing protein [Enterococcus pallens]|uniref:Lipoyl-binding domain-containing protein n=1 Tax=Enterococcus pallens ATCC BAA-351 TaxID=1158607 RepID=R2SFJ8_9ENTE|nr:DUF2118 domain-containing protein [Enterococcus pallens]EOH91691.1 hypothetical protein UAU_02993 [Enterococcus pallens ATCC BAA-351]EOU25119.1 hypothetical protein I588_01107 [Enterococcus pallens ATCC BAA-351]OJG78483.1 hypothetical protein RV10_GL001478 [Enterococcus pallens]
MKRYEITVDGQVYQVTLREISEEEAAQKTAAAQQSTPAKPIPAAPVSQGTEVPAPMAGNVLSVKVKVGDAVQAGDTLLVLEAMKMENEIVAPVQGVVSALMVEAGQSVESGQLLITM